MAMVKKTYPVTGMSCAACASSVESILKAQKGVISASVNFPGKSVLLEYSPEIVNEQQLKEGVVSIGYDIIITQSKKEVEEIENNYLLKLKKNTLFSGIFSAPLFVIGMFFMNMPYGNYIMWALATPVVFIWGKDFYTNAFKQLKHKSANMDTLVALSTGIAYLFSVFNTLNPNFWHQRGLHAHVYFESSAIIIFFILLGKLLEENAKNKTSDAIKKLMGLQPNKVNLVYANGTIQEINIEEVRVGDTLQVKPGEKIPVDGVVINGESYVDESMISGEPVPVIKQNNSKVFSGTINQKGTFQFKANKVGSDTLLAQIIKTVQEAQDSKAPVQQLTDKIASVFVPIVVGISIITLVVWLLVGGENGFTQGLLSMITVLVIACPCALGLATPTALMVGIGKSAGMGILIRDAEALEKAKAINAIVLDKTGTITEGKPTLSELIYFGDSNEKTEMLGRLYGIEQLSEHPLAEATCNYLKNNSVIPIKPEKFNSLTGKGIVAEYKNDTFRAGNLSLMKEAGVEITNELEEKMPQLTEAANSIILFSKNTTIIALIGISDKIKNTSAEAITQFKKKGIEVYMLTGDNEKSAKAIAQKVGIDNVVANTIPSAKADFVKSLQTKGKKVAMIGDGINDSEALAVADVSFAMGKGSDIAMDVAKVTIMSSDLLMVPKAIELSRQTVAKIKQNLFWAFIYNVIGIPIAAGVLYAVNGFMLDPMLAGAAMAMSSVSVVSNSLLLKFKSV